jgi:hypothetical protein
MHALSVVGREPELHCPVLGWADFSRYVLMTENKLYRHSGSGRDDLFVLNIWLYAWIYREIQSTSRQLVAGNEHSEPYLGHNTLKKAVNND